jgi:O-antigen/teichoic acid export membrane protein
MDKQINQKSTAILFITNILSLLVVGCAYITYSKILSPGEFGLYSIGLAVGNFGNLLLDAGIKNTIIKRSVFLDKAEQKAVFSVISIISVTLVLISLLIAYSAVVNRYSDENDIRFVICILVVYLLSYPFCIIPTAFLEKSINYTRIALVESLSNIVERVLPVLIISFTSTGIYSFVLALIFGRLLRVIILNISFPTIFGLTTFSNFLKILPVLREGLWLQLSGLISWIRDNLHVILIGSFFDKTWIGYYAWCMQIFWLIYQIFIHSFYRVSLPIFASYSEFTERWTSCKKQVSLITIAVMPILLGVWSLTPEIDKFWFMGKWATGINLILPFLLIRLIPAVATTIISQMLLVEKAGRVYTYATAYWSVAEIVFAVIAINFFGVVGLAWSYGFVAWVGVFFLTSPLNKQSRFENSPIKNSLFYEIVIAQLKNKSFFITLIAALIYPFFKTVLDVMSLTRELTVLAVISYCFVNFVLVCLSEDIICKAILNRVKRLHN